MYNLRDGIKINVPKTTHSSSNKKQETTMGRSRLEKPKPITSCSTGKEPYRKKTRWMGGCIVKKDVEELGGRSGRKVRAADRERDGKLDV